MRMNQKQVSRDATLHPHRGKPGGVRFKSGEIQIKSLDDSYASRTSTVWTPSKLCSDFTSASGSV